MVKCEKLASVIGHEDPFATLVPRSSPSVNWTLAIYLKDIKVIAKHFHFGLAHRPITAFDMKSKINLNLILGQFKL